MARARPAASEDSPAPPTRERIRAVAEDFYVLRGYEGFSFGDIAQAVGTTRANIHHHFGNKQRLMAELIERFAGRVPVLGVCLGHQCIVEVYGGVVERARRLMHGKVGTIDRIQPDALLDGLAESFEAGRYHSLAAIEPLPEVLIATARDRDGEVMALRHPISRTCTACNSIPSRCSRPRAT